MLFLDKYTGNVKFPDHDVDPKLKAGPDWNREYLMAIYGQYCQNKSGITANDHKSYATLRSYANGSQSTDKYKAILSPPTRSNKGPSYSQADMESGKINPNDVLPDRKGYSSINYDDMVLVSPKYLQVVLDRYHDQQHDVVVDSIGPDSVQAKEDAKLDLWIEKEYADLIKEVHQAAAIPVPEAPQFMPETREDLEMWAEVGGFKTKNEMAMELAIMATFADSNQDQIQLKILRDIYVTNSGVCKDYTDRATGRVKLKYVDPEKFIIDYAPNGDYDYINYGGELIKYSVQQLLPQLQELSDIEVKEILERYSGQLGNPTYEFDSYNSEEKVTSEFLSAHAGSHVLVFDAEYRTNDLKFTSKKTTNSGKEILNDEYFGATSKRSNKKISTSGIDTFYRGKWIVGTDIVFDYGLQYDINRSTNLKTAKSSYHYFRVQGKSKQETIIPFVDQIQLAWYRLQNAIAKARPAGLAIEVTSLENISIGVNKLHPLDVMQIAREDGTLLYKATTHRGHFPTASVANPFTELQGGIGTQLDEFMKIVELNLNLIAETTGVPRIAAGGEPSEDQGLGLSRIAVDGSNKATNYIFKAYLEIKKGTCMSVCRRIQLWVLARDKNYKVYSRAIGKMATQVLKIGGETGNLEFAVNIIPRPSAVEKQRIMDAALVSMETSKGGGVGISLPDYLLVEKTVDRGRLSYAYAILKQKEAEARKTKSEEAQQTVAANGEEQRKSNQQTHENAKEMEALKHNHKMAEIEKQLVVNNEISESQTTQSSIES